MISKHCTTPIVGATGYPLRLLELILGLEVNMSLKIPRPLHLVAMPQKALERFIPNIEGVREVSEGKLSFFHMSAVGEFG